MGIENKFPGNSIVKVPVTFRRFLQRNDGGVDRFRYLRFVIEDCHHQLAIVAHRWTLTGGEGEGLCPTQTNTHAKLTDLRVLVDATRVASYIQTRDTYRTWILGDRHPIVNSHEPLPPRAC